jgi:hypothetical protein
MTGESKPESWPFSSSAIAMESKRDEARKRWRDDSKGNNLAKGFSRTKTF